MDDKEGGSQDATPNSRSRLPAERGKMHSWNKVVELVAGVNVQPNQEAIEGRNGVAATVLQRQRVQPHAKIRPGSANN